MKLATKWMQLILVGVSVLTLASCSTFGKHKTEGSVDDSDASITDANNSYSDANATGVNDEGSFGSEKGDLLSRRTYYFGYDSNTVEESDRPAILANARYLLAHASAQVLLEGHTDPRGSREYNIGLGERRAKSVAAVLTENGVKPAQIRVVSYGAEKLAAFGHDEGAYKLDRRVVMVYTKS